MKKLTNSVSPFIMLLIPLFLLVGLLAINADNDSAAEKQKAGIHLQIPALKDVVKAGI